MFQGFLVDDNKYAMLAGYKELERDYVAYLAGVPCSTNTTTCKPSESKIVQDIQKARDLINSQIGGSGAFKSVDDARIDQLENLVDKLVKRIGDLELQVKTLRAGKPGVSSTTAKPPAGGDDDDDIDLFGSDDDDEEAEKLKAARVEAYNAKKAKKPALIAKSTILLDVKPWDDETDMGEMERLVRSVEADGLLWGASKLIPLAYGIKKLQINCVVEDDKIGTDFLEETICAFEDHVQSVDVAAFNKI